MVLIVLWLVLVTNDVRQHHFHKQKIYLLKNFSIDPASISVKKGLFSSKQHRSTRRSNSFHPSYLTSLVTRTNHNTELSLLTAKRKTYYSYAIVPFFNIKCRRIKEKN